MSQTDELAKLRDEIIAKRVCPHLRDTATQLVMGDGNPDADIVFIGEAPGKKEDEQGLPFVGASGRFLNEMLAAAGMNRADVYITNIVKYRPPNNRDPSPEEKREFWPYLMRQLEIINPRVVITLGRHSGKCFIPELQISRDHGHARTVGYIKKLDSRQAGADAMQGAGEQRTEVYEKYSKGVAETATQQRAASHDGVGSSADEQVVATWLVVPLYHPAAALYNGSMRQTLIDDFLAAAKLATTK